MSKPEMTFTIKGMDCAGCAQSIETGVAQLPGVTACQINFTTEKLRIEGTATPEAISARVRDLGFEVAAQTSIGDQAAKSGNFLTFLHQRADTRLALLGALLILPTVVLETAFGLSHWALSLAAVGALLTAGWPIARSAWRSLRINREININVLMTIAAIGAFIIGEYTEAGMVMVLFAVGEALEGYTASRARDSIRSLMQVVPQVATRLSRLKGKVQEESVPVAALEIGAHIVVKPGERIPMDGQVAAGSSTVNQAPITGESRLIEKLPGSSVFAGSINGEGALEIEVARHAEDNTISRVIRLVEEAQEKRAPAQRFIDRFARYYTPAVVVLAILVAAIPPLLFGQPFFNPNPETYGWLYRGLALLIVACPCALVISTPVSIISAISNAARNGVLIKGGTFLESLSQVRAIAFDKTGTLTRGQPSVVAVRALTCSPAHPDEVHALQTGDCAACDDLIALAEAVERRSEHPLAQAILAESTRRGVQARYPAADDVTTLTGRGVRGQVAGQTVTIGSHRFFEEAVAHLAHHCDAATQDAAEGYTPMMVSAGGEYRGTIAVADTIRKSSRASLAQLNEMGLDATVMLTGDHAATAHKIAAQVGVSDVKADLLPEDKVAAVEALKADYGSVAMVGDGINDAPALAAADVGIAIGGALGGTAQAMETADITLMRDDLRQLPFAIRLSRATMQTIRANVMLSLGIKLLFLVLVLFGWGSMWLAVLADMGTSLLVTLNGMRLLKTSAPE